MFNILVGCICLWVAYDSNQEDNWPELFVPLGIIVGCLSISVGVMGLLT